MLCILWSLGDVDRDVKFILGAALEEDLNNELKQKICFIIICQLQSFCLKAEADLAAL